MAGLLTDLYQLTMAAGYFEAGKTKEIGTFELFFRKLPRYRNDCPFLRRLATDGMLQPPSTQIRIWPSVPEDVVSPVYEQLPEVFVTCL